MTAAGAARLARALRTAPAARRRALLAGIEDPERVVAALKRAADGELARDAAAAIRLARLALAAARLHRDAGAEAVAWHALGKSLHSVSRHRQALVAYRAAARGYARLGRKAEQARVELAAFDAEFRLGLHTTARRTAGRALRALTALGDRVGAAKVEGNLAALLHHEDRHAEALRLIDRAWPVLARAGERLAVAHLELNRACSLTMQGEFEAARPCYEAARRAYARLGRPGLVARVEYNEACDDLLRGRIHEARRRLAAAREAFRRDGNHHALGLAALDEAELDLGVGRADLAAEAAAEAQAGLSRGGARLEAARARVLQAEAARALGEESEARALLRAARREFAALGHDAGVALVQLVEAGSPGLAAARRLSLARAAAATFTRRGLVGRAAAARIVAGSAALELGLARPAASLLRSARDLAVRHSLVDCELGAEHALGRAAEERGRGEEALEAYRRAVSAYERLRAGIRSDADRLAFASSRTAVFEDAVRAALDQGRAAQALDFVERSRARALVDLLGADPRFAAAAAAAGGRLAARLAAIKRRLAALAARGRERERHPRGVPAGLARELREMVLTHERALLRLGRSEPEAAFALTGRPVASLDDIRPLLGRERVLVAWFREGDRYGALVAGAEGVRAHRGIARLGDVERALAVLSFALAAPRRDPRRVEVHRDAVLATASAALEALHRLLLAPLLGSIGDRGLVAVPDASLHALPFHALLARGRAVIEDREVTTAPSATALWLAVRRRPRGTGALVLAHADERAPLIAAEGRAVARALGANLVAGRRATAQALRRLAPGKRILHLAAHGAHRTGEPLLAGLDLADGRLTLPELATLRLDAELVVLSACDSGLGVAQGDEVQGLVRTALHCGARSVVASLWAVADDSTAELMTAFYRRLGPACGPAAALRAAVREMKTSRPHPFHWAPFQLVGAWDGLYCEERPSFGQEVSR